MTLLKWILYTGNKCLGTGRTVLLMQNNFSRTYEDCLQDFHYAFEAWVENVRKTGLALTLTVYVNGESEDLDDSGYSSDPGGGEADGPLLNYVWTFQRVVYCDECMHVHFVTCKSSQTSFGSREECVLDYLHARDHPCESHPGQCFDMVHVLEDDVILTDSVPSTSPTVGEERSGDQRHLPMDHD